MRVRLVWTILWVAACSSEGDAELSVFVQTDLVFGTEFDVIDATLLRDGVAEGSLEHREPGDYFDGVRVGTWRTKNGVVEVQLVLRRMGDLIASRRVLTSVDGNTAVTIVITRSCLGIECPGVGDAASSTQCVGGVCVPPTCVPEVPDSCGSATPSECSCPNAPTCVRSRCAGAACLQAPDDSMCAGGSCSVTLGCLAGGDIDGGIRPDIGVPDVGVPDIGPLDVSLPDVSFGIDAARCVDGTRCEDSSETCCSGLCFDLRVTPFHCGSCGRVCSPPAECVGGDCRSPSSCGGQECALTEECCSGSCENTLSDPDHCGGCGVRCDPGETCAGSCIAVPGLCGSTTCSGSQECCNGSCVDTGSSTTHCGRCNNFCAPRGDRCVGGQCRCGSMAACSTLCTGGGCL